MTAASGPVLKILAGSPFKDPPKYGSALKSFPHDQVGPLHLRPHTTSLELRSEPSQGSDGPSPRTKSGLLPSQGSGNKPLFFRDEALMPLLRV